LNLVFTALPPLPPLLLPLDTHAWAVCQVLTDAGFPAAVNRGNSVALKSAA
jgi:hypothetical protein